MAAAIVIGIAGAVSAQIDGGVDRDAGAERDDTGSVWAVVGDGVRLVIDGGNSECFFRRPQPDELLEWMGGLSPDAQHGIVDVDAGYQFLEDGTRQLVVVRQCGSSRGFLWADIIDPEDVAVDARRLLEFPTLSISTSPSGYAVSGIPLWLEVSGLSWAPFSATATAGGVTATVTATPLDVRWDMGPVNERVGVYDRTVVCGGPGTTYVEGMDVSDPPCGYWYRSSSAGFFDSEGRFDRVTVTTTVAWQLSWTSNIGRSEPNWDTDTRQVVVHDFAVQEAQSINISNPGQGG